MPSRELPLILASVGVVAALGSAGWLPKRMELGSLLAVAALALLLQGFFRDLHTLARQRRAGPPTVPAEELSCICLESTLGLSTILAGLGLTALGLTRPISTPAALWPVLAATIWLFGFATRDVVLQWRPWALRRVHDHGSLIVRWRAGRRQE